MEKDEAEKGGGAGACSVCFEEFDEALHLPRLLHCGHSFCTQCLTDLPRTTPHTLSCPRCRAPTRLDVSGAQALPCNFDLLDVLTQALPHNFDLLNMLEQARTLKPMSCVAHKGKRLKYWCDQDNTAVCTSCLLFGDHQGHKPVPIEEAAAKATSKARADAIEIEANLRRIDEALADVRAREVDAQQCAATARAAARKHFDRLKAALAQREDAPLPGP
jgi:hypothetical protein